MGGERGVGNRREEERGVRDRKKKEKEGRRGVYIDGGLLEGDGMALTGTRVVVS